MIPDTITIQLRSFNEPDLLIDSVRIILDQTGNGSGRFFNAINNTPYYLVVKHRNSLETWSASSVVFTNNQLTYDFTTSQNKAYGNNLKLIGTKWCIYSGDVNQNGLIGIEDLTMIFTDNVLGTQGHNSTDLNADGYVDAEDLSIVFINSVTGIEVKRPVK